MSLFPQAVPRPTTRRVVATLVLLLAAGTATATPWPQSATERWGIPDSPRGQRIAAVLDAIASGDDAVVAATLEEHFAPEFVERFPVAQHQQVFRQMHATLGGEFQHRGVRMRSDTEVEVELAGASQAVRVSFTFDPEDEFRIASIAAERAEAPAAPAAGMQPENADDLRALLDRAAADEGFGGVLLVGSPEGVDLLHAVGLADKGASTPIGPETAFNIGSLTKDFTQVAILRLYERGLLDLDDTLGKHLGGFPSEVADSVTVRHLLAHRSGWGHYWDHPEYLARFQDLYELDDYLDFIRTLPLDFEPGSREQYSNTGYEVLGAIVEAVSGMPYSEFVQAEIFEPLGMTSTGNFDRDLPHVGRARGYTNEHPRGPTTGFVRENTYMLPPRGTSAGGTFSTAPDLLRFWSALLTTDLLAPSSRALMLSGYARDEAGPLAGQSVWAGGGPGVRAYIGVNYETGRLVILLANVDGRLPADLHTAAYESPIGR